jgi:methylated-DNA-[protein]-cysteine S-methyltransferase
MSIAQTRLFQGYLDSRLGMIHMLLDQNGALIRLDFSERPEYRRHPGSAGCRCGLPAIA